MNLKKKLSALLAAVLMCGLLCVPAGATPDDPHEWYHPVGVNSGVSIMFSDCLSQGTRYIHPSGTPLDTDPENTCEIYGLSRGSKIWVAMDDPRISPVGHIICRFYPAQFGAVYESYDTTYTIEGAVPTSAYPEFQLDDLPAISDLWYCSVEEIPYANPFLPTVRIDGFLIELEGEAVTPSAQQPSGWAKGLVDEAAGKGLVTERTEGLYQDSITRLQFAELAVNLIEKATGKEITPAQNTFNDTSDVMALKAVAAGVASGKGEGQFAPDAQITRQEMCVMLSKVIEYVDAANGSATLANTSTQLDTAKFSDTGDVASWARPAVALLTNNGLMSGSNGRVAPKDNTTVEQAIILVLAHFNKF